MKGFLSHIALLLLGTSGSVLGAQNSPDIRRICLDRINGTVSIFWTASDAPCSSFSAYEIWGRDDTTNNFIFLKSEVNQTTTSSVIGLPNQKRWQFFLIAKYSCPGFPNYHSDTVFIDDQEPPPVSIDSVSVVLADQKIIVGWQKSLANDLQGYFLYKVGSSNAIIADTNSTTYKFSKLNASVAGNRVALAAYDSCLQAGLISVYHEPVLLSSSDSNYCQKQFKLTFSPYIGWSVSKYEVFVWAQGDIGYEKTLTLSSSDILSFDLILKKRDLSYNCFVRAFNVDGSISSSSNILTLRIDSVVTHTYATIRSVSEINKTIEIRAEFDNPNGRISKASLLFSVDGFTWNVLTESPSSPIVGFLPNTDVKIRYFTVAVHDNCNNQINSIHLSNNIVFFQDNNIKTNLNWNAYSYWSAGIQQYNILQGKPNNPLSTWNIYNNFSSNLQPVTIPINDEKQPCYCVLAISNRDPLTGRTDSSFSNILCPYGTEGLYIPNTFTPNDDGKNDVFNIYGLPIDPDKSEITIFNRWGAKVAISPVRTGWDGRDNNKQLCPAGMYAYIIKAVLNDGSYYQLQGTTLLIQ